MIFRFRPALALFSLSLRRRVIMPRKGTEAESCCRFVRYHIGASWPFRAVFTNRLASPGDARCAICILHSATFF